ncbi:TVP38/TMEM64 family protein [Nitratireductor sp. GCM10026969]|uniref:TVP38/TMEM64 family protein n=1 Tax=Nitratireductor sp. GCM10026969 TaxID=3252645 RepID=UPI003606BDC6
MTKADDRKGAAYRRTAWRFAPLVVIMLALAATYALGWHRHLSISGLAESRAVLKAYVDLHPVLAPALFVLVYAAAVAISFPAASLLTVAGGFLFGWLVGGTLVIIAATTGATLLFLAARTALRGVLRARAGERISRLADGFEASAFGYLLILRLAPVFPFWLVNIAPAFFDVRVSTYVGATALGIMPGCFAYAYLGEGLESVLLAAAQSGQDLHFRELVTPELTLALFLLAALAAVPILLRRLRGAGSS